MLAAQADARLAVASVALITRQFEDTPYEVTLPRVPWLRELTEFVRRAPGQFDAGVINEVDAALKRWLRLEAPAR